MKRRFARTLGKLALTALLAAGSGVCEFNTTAAAAVPPGARAISAQAEVCKALLILADNSSTATSNGTKGKQPPPPPPPPVCKPPPVSCYR